MVFESRIEINPKIMLGKPVVKGTRIPVYVILNLLGEGMNMEEILRQYPDLTREDILSTLRFASRFTQFEELEQIAS